jgi:hypothetical protein
MPDSKLKKKKGKTIEEVYEGNKKQRLYVLVRKWKMITDFI